MILVFVILAKLLFAVYLEQIQPLFRHEIQDSREQAFSYTTSKITRPPYYNSWTKVVASGFSDRLLRMNRTDGWAQHVGGG